SITGLAAGMAHEINNPLAGIIQNTIVLENRITGNLDANIKAAKKIGISIDSIHKYADLREIKTIISDIKESGSRATGIVKNMLNFAQDNSLNMKNCSMVKLLDDTIELVKSDFDMVGEYDFNKINIIRKYDKDTPVVNCEPEKIQQAITNIIENSTEAMLKQPTENLNPQLKLKIHSDEELVYIEIEDNGPGIDENIIKRIFDPFFTTKDVGKGIGLGLSISHFIITDTHKGIMKVETKKGNWTKFTIGLPF
ncbi:sensor histidine kinase, partial [Spirochaetota bacterium]